MGDAIQWVTLASFSGALEADIARTALEAEEIPVLVRGNHSGIFGAGFQGTVMGGIELMVPDVALERARELIDMDAA